MSKNDDSTKELFDVNYYKNLFKKDNGLASSLISQAPSNMGSGYSVFPSTEASIKDVGESVSKFGNTATNMDIASPNSNLFGFSNNQISGFADLANVGLGIANAYTNIKNSKLDRENIKQQIAMRQESWNNFKKSREGFNNFRA
jgi:hypothetical protein